MENKINLNNTKKLNDKIESVEFLKNSQFIGSFQFLFFGILISLVFGILFNSNVDYPRPFIFLVPIVFTIVAANLFDRYTYIAMLIYTNVFLVTFQPWEFVRSSPFISIAAINGLLIMVAEMIYANSTARKELQSALFMRGNMLEATYGLVEEFLSTANISKILPEFLKALREAGSISRVYIYKRIAEDEYSLQYEEVISEMERFTNNPKLQLVNLKAINSEAWEDIFQKRIVMNKSADEMANIRKILDLDNNGLSASFAPIFTKEGIWGILGISFKRKSKIQMETLTDSIKTIAVIIGALIQREKNELVLINRSKELEELNKLMIGREIKMAELKEKLQTYEKSS